jgi:hypothetical protein
MMQKMLYTMHFKGRMSSSASGSRLLRTREVLPVAWLRPRSVPKVCDATSGPFKVVSPFSIPSCE